MNLKKLFDAVNAAQARVQQLAAQIVALFDEGKVADALARQADLEDAKRDYQEKNQLYLSVLAATTGNGDPASRFVPLNGDPEPEQVRDLRATNEYMRNFFDAFRVGASPKTIQAGQHSAERFGMLMNALTETGGVPPGSEGGFLLPTDFDNMIHERMRQFVDLSTHVNVENVTAFSGWRAVETATAMLPFVALAENNPMPGAEEPRFIQVPYQVVDYGGWLPVTNGLLADTPVNIMAYLSRWFAKKVVLTNNSLVLPVIQGLVPVPVALAADTAAAIKTALNVTLDPDVSASAEIWVNQTGFDILDQAVDNDGRPMLQPDPTNATARRMFGRSVVVLANRLWPDLVGPARTPIFVGDGRELMTFFRRAPFEMAATTIGGNAWRNNTTEVRGIMRADVAQMDAASGVYIEKALV